ncbi:hypothetical protein ACFN9K_004426, partial [Salmonella enterica]
MNADRTIINRDRRTGQRNRTTVIQRQAAVAHRHRRIGERHPLQVHVPARRHAGIVKYPAAIGRIHRAVVV